MVTGFSGFAGPGAVHRAFWGRGPALSKMPGAVMSCGQPATSYGPVRTPAVKGRCTDAPGACVASVAGRRRAELSPTNKKRRRSDGVAD